MTCGVEYFDQSRLLEAGVARDLHVRRSKIVASLLLRLLLASAAGPLSPQEVRKTKVVRLRDRGASTGTRTVGNGHGRG